ncbi:hypothetical protein ONZ45_g10974 [Pleurotus djamor]|nr:hypothetical protein ONZ45_g10974 [Pleurotus djamor]
MLFSSLHPDTESILSFNYLGVDSQAPWMLNRRASESRLRPILHALDNVEEVNVGCLQDLVWLLDDTPTLDRTKEGDEFQGDDGGEGGDEDDGDDEYRSRPSQRFSLPRLSIIRWTSDGREPLRRSDARFIRLVELLRARQSIGAGIVTLELAYRSDMLLNRELKAAVEKLRTCVGTVKLVDHQP